MPLMNIAIALIVVGVALWLINNFIPMASSIKTILNVVVVVAVGIWVLKVFGLWGRVTNYRLHWHVSRVRLRKRREVRGFDDATRAPVRSPECQFSRR